MLGACHAALGYPVVTADELMEAVAIVGGKWRLFVEDKATKFQVSGWKVPNALIALLQ